MTEPCIKRRTWLAVYNTINKICGNLVSWVYSTSVLLGLGVLVALGVLYEQGLYLDEIQALLVIVDILLGIGILV